MNPGIFRLIMPVSDLDRAVRFYSEVLGIAGMRVSDGRHYFDCGGVILACFDPQADGDGYAPTPNPEHVYIAVDDIASVYRTCQRVGIQFAEGDIHGEPAGQIATRPWGERSFYVQDPFGNKLCFVDRKTTYRGPS